MYKPNRAAALSVSGSRGGDRHQGIYKAASPLEKNQTQNLIKKTDTRHHDHGQAGVYERYLEGGHLWYDLTCSVTRRLCNVYREKEANQLS